jgi:hypothetical protein
LTTIVIVIIKIMVIIEFKNQMLPLAVTYCRYRQSVDGNKLTYLHITGTRDSAVRNEWNRKRHGRFLVRIVPRVIYLPTRACVG